MSILTIDINGYCNEVCQFCYQNLDGSSLPEQEIARIIGSNPHAKTVEIGGGEPFLDPRIVRLTKTIREKEKNVHISTNASFIPKEFLDLEEIGRASCRESV